jgi:hypothetical protein
VCFVGDQARVKRPVTLRSCQRASSVLTIGPSARRAVFWSGRRRATRLPVLRGSSVGRAAGYAR